ncbi:hypothetical protein AXK56_16745 [Tsukamurella pulmonis]|uniref:Uncharacterized protein n=1 Tax=Tsukamurella pulmonis TaxID=47312 RepID=A0A1H1ACB1_9ACTN|nr:hypothetical protein [Tsukamurella pulmonis]KXO95858.1 hypothetical protein AXK56_16745 [Tsukamurella pulmonis]SDQ37378.1 hypothetical protein SAMN04489765_0159 [Tsukamurella pulmonis]SUQ39377.1 Uncharacterised protein [Tsukamurella pulmonis]
MNAGTSGTVQLDLFGEVEAEEQAQLAQAALAAERAAAFEQLVSTAVVTAAEAEAAGIYNVKTETTTVWICPACEGWEANDYLLSQNHGIGPHYLTRDEDGEWHDGRFGRTWCIALDLTANHATYGEGWLHPRQHAMIARLRPEIRALYDDAVASRPRRGPGA